MKVTVYFTPAAVKAGVIKKATVVLADVLRMTTTASTYLYHGAAAVALFPEPASAKAAFAKFKRGEGILAGETHGEKVAGFPMGGSPLESSRDKVRGRTVCLSSRSAQAFKALKGAETLLLGSFVNLQGVYNAVLRLNRDVVIVCGSSDHGPCPEDITFAGMLSDFLMNTVGSEPVMLAESAVKAVTQYKPWQGRLLELLRGSAEGKDLALKGREQDLNYCAKINRLEEVPILKNGVFVRESAPRSRLKTLGNAKAEAASPSKGKAIKVHVPLFPKNPEHPTPDLEPKKKSTSAKPTPPAPGKPHAPKSPSSASPTGIGRLAAASKAPATVKEPAKTGTAPTAGKPTPAASKPLPRKTPLFSKRTVAVSSPKPIEPVVAAVTHAVDALKASLAHLKTKHNAPAAPSAAKKTVPAKKPTPKSPKKKR